MRKIRRMTSFIFAIAMILTVAVGGFVMPQAETFAEDRQTPVLTIGQIIEFENEGVHRDYTFSYEFRSAGDGFPLPEGADGGSWIFDLTNDDRAAVSFLTGDEEASPGSESIRFTSMGLYHYELEQIIPSSRKNISCDESVYDIFVKVSNKRGLSVEAVWVQRETGEKPDSIVFSNSVRNSSVIGDPPVNVVKRIEGDAPTKDDKFVFVMKPEQENFPLPYGAKGQYEVSLYGEGEVEIGNIAFSEPGIYEYTVYEKSDPALSYTFDKTVFRVKYTVDELEDGTLTCDREIIRDDEEEQEKCVFTNKYNASKTTPQGDTRRDDKDPHRGGSSGGKVKTGDYNRLSNYIAMLFVAAVMIMTMSLKKKRR